MTTPQIEAAWGFYQNTVAAYREPDSANSKPLMQAPTIAIGNKRPPSSARASPRDAR